MILLGYQNIMVEPNFERTVIHMAHTPTAVSWRKKTRYNHIVTIVVPRWTSHDSITTGGRLFLDPESIIAYSCTYLLMVFTLFLCHARIETKGTWVGNGIASGVCHNLLLPFWISRQISKMILSMILQTYVRVCKGQYRSKYKDTQNP